MRRAVIVFLGGGAGACLRALILQWLAPWGGALPAPVLLINLVGAFCLGLIVVLADEAGLLDVQARLFLAVGVLGGFTTFSTFGWGADLLLAHGARVPAALIYLGASAVGGVAAAQIGMIAGRELVALLERAAVALLRRIAARGMRRMHNARAESDTIEAEDHEETA